MSPIRHRSIFSALVIVFSSVLWACRSDEVHDVRAPEAVAERIDTVALIVQQVSRQARLHTTEFHVHKVVLHSDDTRLKGKLFSKDVDLGLSLGERKVAIPIDVTLKASIDFSHFSGRNIERADSVIVVTLPDPQISITASRVDHEGTRQYVSLTRQRFSDAELSELARQGADTVAAHIGSYGVLEAARNSAARSLVPIISRMGYDERHIIIRFRKNFDAEEIHSFITINNANKG